MTYIASAAPRSTARAGLPAGAARGTVAEVTDGYPGIWVKSDAWRDAMGGLVDMRYAGAKLDAATDDTAAFQAANQFLAGLLLPGVNFQSNTGVFNGGAPALGGGILYVPYGVAVVSSLLLEHRVGLRGNGDFSIVRKLAGSAGPLIANRYDASVHAKYNRIENIRLDGNKANVTDASPVLLLRGDATNNYTSPLDEDYDSVFRVEGVYIINGKGDGLRAEGAGGSWYRDVKVRSCDGDGIYSWQDNKFIGCDVAWSGIRGFHCAGDGTSYTDCKSWYSGRVDATNGWGWFMTADSGGMVNCEAQDNQRSGFAWDGARNWICHALRSDDNDIIGYDDAAFNFWDSTHIKMTGMCRNRYNANWATINSAQTIAVRFKGNSAECRIDVEAGKGEWGTKVALSADSVKTNSSIVVNGVERAAGATL